MLLSLIKRLVILATFAWIIVRESLVLGAKAGNATVTLIGGKIDISLGIFPPIGQS